MKFREVAYKPITDEQIKAIIGQRDDVDSDVLRSDLDDAAEQFIHAHYEQQAFPHADLAKRLNNIETTATRLLKLLKSGNRTKRQLGHIRTSAGRLHGLLTVKTSDSIELESILNVGHTGEKEKARRESFNGQLASLIVVVKLLSEAGSWNAEIPNISRHLTLLERVARHGATVQSDQKEKSKSRHKEDQAFTELLADIHQIYMIHFNMWPSVSRSSGEPDGRFMAFVNSVLGAIKENHSNAVRNSDPKISTTLEKTPEAIYAYIKEFNKEQKQF